MFTSKFYYTIKPLIPRPLQIFLRRKRAIRLRRKFADTWPIDPQSARPPAGWPGWPEGKKFALVLTHDVDTERGLQRCMQLAALEKELGIRSIFNFVPEDRYILPSYTRTDLLQQGFGIGVHGLKHDGKLFRSLKDFEKRAPHVNNYLKEWGVRGFSSPSMHHKLEWMHRLDIDYSTSTFDTDPFEPQPDSIGSIFPMVIYGPGQTPPYVEIPLTLVQDFTLFIILQEKTIDIWKRKLAWIAENGGAAVLNTHSDYMNFTTRSCEREEYPVELYLDFITFVQRNYAGQYWHALPAEVAKHFKAAITSSSEQ